MLFELGATAVVVSELPSPRLRTCLPDDGTLDGKLAHLKKYLVALRALGVDPGPSTVVARPFRDDGWALRWKEFFRPLRIGRRLMVKPSWDVSPVKRADLLISLDPGMAFGTGQHPTTRMCLELLEQAMEQFIVQCSGFTDQGSEPSRKNLRTMNYELRTLNKGPAVLDLGTGSGLLAIAALRLGAATVLALDTDKVACRIASDNIRHNGGDRRIIVKRGSLDAAGRRTFDLILANLTAEPLISLAPRLARALKLTGRLIASGILASQEARVSGIFRRCGLVVERTRSNRGWVALVCRRRVAPARGAC
jgi:ribosomal protein L11 methyltransferase